MDKKLNITPYTVKPVLRDHSKIDKTKILMTNGSLMKVESIAECWSILQYFWPALSDNYTPANFVCGGYTVFTLFVRACVCASVRTVLFP